MCFCITGGDCGCKGSYANSTGSNAAARMEEPFKPCILNWNDEKRARSSEKKKSAETCCQQNVFIVLGGTAVARAVMQLPA